MSTASSQHAQGSTSVGSLAPEQHPGNLDARLAENVEIHTLSRQHESPDPHAFPQPTVVTIGVFDGLHQGHARLVRYAVDRGRHRGLPTALVTFDPHPARFLGLARDTAALTSIAQRAELAAAFGVDYLAVLRFDHALADLSPRAFATNVLRAALGAEEVVVGTNFTFGHRAAGSADTLRELGTELGFEACSIPLLSAGAQPCSSTYIRGCIRRGALIEAAYALGRPHRVDGICSGRFVQFMHDPVLPPPGRYIARINGRFGTLQITSTGKVELHRETSRGPISIEFAVPQAPGKRMVSSTGLGATW